MIFDSFLKSFKRAVFKTKYGEMSYSQHRSNRSKILWEITALARFVKLGGKTSIVEFNFSKVASQKSEAVTNMERFLNVFLGILQNFLKLSKK